MERKKKSDMWKIRKKALPPRPQSCLQKKKSAKDQCPNCLLTLSGSVGCGVWHGQTCELAFVTARVIEARARSSSLFFVVLEFSSIRWKYNQTVGRSVKAKFKCVKVKWNRSNDEVNGASGPPNGVLEFVAVSLCRVGSNFELELIIRSG